MKVLLPLTAQIIENLREKSSLLQTCLAPSLPSMFIKEYQEHISCAEMLTLSQLTAIGYHRAVDWTQCTVLRVQSHRPSMALKHTMFTKQPRPVKHYNTIKYKKQKEKLCFFHSSCSHSSRKQSAVTLTHQYPAYMMLRHSQSGFCPPVIQIKRLKYHAHAVFRQAEQLTNALDIRW